MNRKENSRAHDASKTSVSARAAKLLLKQTAAATVFTLLIWTAHNIGVPAINNWADAFDAAVSHETDISAISDIIARFAEKTSRDAVPSLPNIGDDAVTLH